MSFGCCARHMLTPVPHLAELRILLCFLQTTLSQTLSLQSSWHKLCRSQLRRFNMDLS
jgi:hypothetical protein